MKMEFPDGTVIEMEQDTIDVTSLSVPDLAWRYVDVNGHEHAWRSTGTLAVDLPTLRLVVDQEAEDYIDEDGFESWAPPVTHYECVICGAVVPDPAMKANDQQMWTGGLRSYRINGEPGTREDVEALVKTYRP